MDDRWFDIVCEYIKDHDLFIYNDTLCFYSYTHDLNKDVLFHIHTFLLTENNNP